MLSDFQSGRETSPAHAGRAALKARLDTDLAGRFVLRDAAPDMPSA